MNRFPPAGPAFVRFEPLSRASLAEAIGDQVASSTVGLTDAEMRASAVGVDVSRVAGLARVCVAQRVASNATTTLVGTTAYLSSLVIGCSAAGTSWALRVQNREGTPKILLPSLLLLAVMEPLVFPDPVLMTGGIDVVTSGSAAGVVDIFATYWQ